MNENEIIQMLPERLKGLAGQTAAFEIQGMDVPGREMFKGSGRGPVIPDLVLRATTRTKGEYFFYFDVKSTGQPRYVRLAINELQEMVAGKPRVYGILAVPYLSEESIGLCKQNGVGYVDLAGNCLIDIDELYIDVRGRGNPKPDRRRLKSLFSPRSARAVRLLLLEPKREWFVRDLAKEADISLGLASNLKQKFLDFELMKTNKNKSFLVSSPEELLARWSASYSYRVSRQVEFYSFDDVGEIEGRLAVYCKGRGIRYGFTLSSGASLSAPALRYNKVFAYVDGPFEPLAAGLGWKRVESGGNILLMEPYDKGVFYGLREIDGKAVVSDVQLYLDLKSYKGRGEEAAEFLLENRLRKKW